MVYQVPSYREEEAVIAVGQEKARRAFAQQDSAEQAEKKETGFYGDGWVFGYQWWHERHPGLRDT